MPYPYEEIQTEQRRFPIGWIALLIIVILLASVVVTYIVSKPIQKQAVTQTTVTVPGKELSLNLALASFIDDSYKYVLQPNSAYEQGNPVYIYVEVKDFTQSNLKIDVNEDVDIKDSSGKTVFAQKNFGSLKQVFTQTLPLVKFRNIFPTITWTPGKYTATVKINDNLSKKSTSKTIEFTLEKRSAESINEVVDLSSLAENAQPIKLAEFITTTGPDGNIIPELTYNITYSQLVSKDELSKITADFEIPSRFDAGTYSVEFRFENPDTGKSQTLTKQIVVTKTLEIKDFVFASIIDDKFNYQVQSDATYKQGDTVNIYLNLIDFAQPLSNGKYNVKFTEDMNISDSTGEVILSNTNYVAINDFNDIKRDSYSIKNSILSEAFAPGKYIVKIIIKDLNSAQEAVREGQFQLQ